MLVGSVLGAVWNKEGTGLQSCLLLCNSDHLEKCTESIPACESRLLGSRKTNNWYTAMKSL